MSVRVGQGFDAHPFASGTELVIGGVVVPDSDGLEGHSDADVLCHAITDALLGAAGLGDLGGMFPPEERWRDASSIAMLEEAHAAVAEAGFILVNIDATVIAERPRLAPFLKRMGGNIARALKVDASRISVKATSTDGMGFTGRGEGIAATAVVMLDEHTPDLG